MRIKKLVIDNIASIAHAEIDFECPELANESLFLISGETGSGKSTILDCLCLTLYGNTPRLNNSSSRESYTASTHEDTAPNDAEALSVNDPRQLLRRGEGEGRTVLTFTGNDDKDYQAEWSVRRARGKADGHLQAYKWAVTCTTTGATTERKADNQNMIATAVGMTEIQFYRTVILPQGQFDQFLKSKADEKSAILEKLTGTQIYTQLGKRIYDTAKEKQADADAQRQRMEGITLLTDKEKEDIANQLGDLQQQKEAHEKQRQEAETSINVIEEWTKACQRAKTIKEKLELARKSVESDTFASENELIKQWYQSTDARSALTSRDIALRQCQDLERRRTTLKAETQKLLAGDAYLKDRLKTLQAEQEQYGVPEKYQAEVSRLEQSLQALDMPALQQRKDELGKEFLAMTKALEEIKKLQRLQQVSSKAQQEVIRSQNAEQKLRDSIAPLEEQFQQAQNKHQRAKEEYDHQYLSVDDWSKKARKSLKSGDHCPVCGKLVDKILDDAPFEQLVAPLKKAADDAYRELINAQTNVNVAKEKVGILSNETKDLCQKAQEAQEECRQQQANTTKALAKCQLTLDAQITETITEKMSDNERQAHKLSESINQANALQEALKTVRQQMDLAKRTQDEIIRVNRELKSADYPKDTMKQFIENENIIVSASINIDNLATRWISLAQDYSKWDANLATQRNIAAKNDQIINEFIGNSDITAERLVQLSQTTAQEIEDIKTQHDQLSRDIERLVGESRSAQRQQEDRQAQRDKLGDVTLDSLRQRQLKANTTITRINQDTGALQQRLDTDQQNAERVSKMQQELDSLQANANEWMSLNALLGSSDGKKLRNIAQSFILNDLLNHANYYLSRFNDRYLLTCQPGSLTILVSDLHCGSRVSSVNQLSGGESFMVSLALALALARMTGNVFAVDTLFIDEGFGSLSHTCLDKVMDTLERLHTMGGRRVGIISHVESLKGRVPTQIIVKRNPNDNTQSTITITTDTQT
ncbi:MAG: AAA family ATPase [Muribaculaceae bacterium]|nr:AAA family ATPase [Muribaculaceae bacterium]